MKIVISQPMNGLTEDQIRANRAAVVDELTAQGHTIVDSVFPDFDTSKVKNVPLCFLGKSFQLIAEEADAVYFMSGWESARGCRMEFEACSAYGIKVMGDIKSACPDPAA